MFHIRQINTIKTVLPLLLHNKRRHNCGGISFDSILYKRKLVVLLMQILEIHVQVWWLQILFHVNTYFH
jgi:hypothetical protein